jgi:predicted nucleic acid-binding protein
MDRGDDLVLPASAYAEALVAPHRRGAEAVATVDAFLDALPARIEPATRAIARHAAELRARHGSQVRLPDALVIATAIVVGDERVITTDARWPDLPVLVEVIAPEAR